MLSPANLRSSLGRAPYYQSAARCSGLISRPLAFPLRKAISRYVLYKVKSSYVQMLMACCYFTDYDEHLFHVNLCRSSRCLAPLNAALTEIDISATVSHSRELLNYLCSNQELSLQRLLHIADAAVQVDATAPAPQDNGWLTPLVDGLEAVLRYLQTGLDRYSVPYSYGWSIVALTAAIKLATFPLTRQQVESTMSMQSLKPQIDAIKAKYGENKEAVQRETSALYEKAGVNPLAGCLPTLATIPIFIGLYRSLTSVAAQGDLDNAGFYWIPSLAGPTSVAAQKAGAGTEWLFPFVDGAPPIGWLAAGQYLALPIALIVAQYISSAIITPPIDPNADNAKVQKAMY